MTWCAEHDPGVRCPWAATWNVHQGTHTGQGVRNTGRGICDAGTKYTTWGHGTQGIKIQQRGPEDPFHVSAWGPACSSRSQFSLLTKASLCFASSSSISVGAKEWAYSRGVGPRVPPKPPSAQKWGQGLGPSPWLRKSLLGPQLQSVRGRCKRQHWPA